MSKKLEQITIRVEPWVVDWYTERAEEEMRADPGRVTTRADVMRRVLTRYAEEHRAPKPQSKRTRS